MHVETLLITEAMLQSREEISKKYYEETVSGADTEEVSIQQEDEIKKKKTFKEETRRTVEVSREMRERQDGSVYYEVEYDDGSMEEIDVEVKALPNKV